jgi:ZIP family zinc transporter
LINLFSRFNPIYQSLIAGIFTFSFTVIGASVVFIFKKVNKNIMDTLLAISAGIMLAASFFSLLEPAIAMDNSSWFTIFLGFFIGGVFLYVGDQLLDLLSNRKINNSGFSFKKCAMLFTSITLHNIPEGLVIGVAFGAVAYNTDSTSLISALTLTLGIALQNFPEGSAISLPLRREGLSRWKSFVFAVLSGIVEPIFSVIGIILIMKIKIILPFILSFAAGAMIFVILMELIPESQYNQKKDLMALFTMLGFSIMMILEITLG